MLAKNTIEVLKKDWFSFEQINELKSRLESIDNWTAEFLEEDEFWNLVKSDITNFHKKNIKCIK